MKVFIAVLKNNYLRTVPRIIPITIYTIVTLAAILFSVYLTGTQQVKARIVFIPESASVSIPQSTKALNVTVSSEKPPRSNLLEQKYDAFVTAQNDGNYQIETLRNDNFKSMLELLLHNPKADVSQYQTERGVGVNIIGFMMMFLLMSAFTNMFAFADDKEQGQLKRIIAAPISFIWYLAAHCFYCLTMLFPEYLLLVLLKLCGWNIGFSLLQHAGLMVVLAFLGISFALLLNTLIKKPDNANMLGNSIAILTSILAGSFSSLSYNSTVMDHIIKVLPQRELMDFAAHLQNGTAVQSGPILYVIVFSLVLFTVSCIILRKAYVKKI